MKFLSTVFTVSCAASTILMAANPVIPTPGDIMRQVEPPKVPQSSKTIPSLPEETYKTPLKLEDSVKIFVKTFVFKGNNIFTSKELSALVKPYENKELGINELKEIASIVTKFYRDHGYFVARAYIPAQDLKNETVEIAIVEGVYGSFDIKNSSHVKTQEIQGFMDYLKQGQSVSTMSLERQMLLINELSGAQVTSAEVYPGKEIGTSDFGISVGALPKYTGYAIVDNYGDRYTGRNRLSAGGNINSITGIGDTLTINGLVSDSANLKNARVAYERPLGYSGLNGGISFSATDYKLREELSYLDGFGRTNTLNVFVNYPTLKTSTHTQAIELDFDHRDMRDSLMGDEAYKTADALTLKATDRQGISIMNLPGTINSSFGFVVGKINLKNNTAVVNDELLRSDGGYSKATIDASYIQSIARNTSLQTAFRAQKSFGKNLDSSEDISVSGENGVRAYGDSELSGDQGYVVNLNLIYNLPQMNLITHSASLFIDHAKVWKNTITFNTENNDRMLNAVGFGYTLDYKTFNLKATYAHGFGVEATPTSDGGSTNLNKFFIQGMLRF